MQTIVCMRERPLVDAHAKVQSAGGRAAASSNEARMRKVRAAENIRVNMQQLRAKIEEERKNVKWLSLQPLTAAILCARALQLCGSSRVRIQLSKTNHEPPSAARRRQLRLLCVYVFMEDRWSNRDTKRRRLLLCLCDDAREATASSRWRRWRRWRGRWRR